MQRNLSGYISLMFLVLFTCTFSFRHAVAATGNLGHNTIGLFKSIEKRTHDCVPENADLFENECEDGTEDEATASFTTISCLAGNSSRFNPTLIPEKAFSYSTFSFHSEIKDPLYLVMRSFRI